MVSDTSMRTKNQVHARALPFVHVFMYDTNGIRRWGDVEPRCFNINIIDSNYRLLGVC